MPIRNLIHSVDSPVEQKHTGKGNPNAILLFDTALNNRQKRLLEQLPDFDSRAVVSKKSVNMADLAALTAKTGCEFAMFTRGSQRLIVRGNAVKVQIEPETAHQMAAQGYRWSGHTHPGTNENCLIASEGDVEILQQFSQENSVIFKAKGQRRIFNR